LHFCHLQAISRVTVAIALLIITPGVSKIKGDADLARMSFPGKSAFPKGIVAAGKPLKEHLPMIPYCVRVLKASLSAIEQSGLSSCFVGFRT
jgi:hypothetical protein